MKTPSFPSPVCAGAALSPCGTWRYRLWRQWSPGDRLLFIGLNPSTADAHQDDPTVRRMRGFARREGYGGLELINLYAYRATDPADLWKQPASKRLGPQWRLHCTPLLEAAEKAVCCWGAFPKAKKLHREQAAGVVVELRRELRRHNTRPHHFGLTRGGHPRHPLYLRADCPLVKGAW